MLLPRNVRPHRAEADTPVPAAGADAYLTSAFCDGAAIDAPSPFCYSNHVMNELTSIPVASGAGAAYLSHRGGFSSFSFGGDVIRFATPQCLRRYIQVKKWEDGYIEVDADYGHGAEEDYIDLLPILKNLYYDAEEFLRPILKVEVRYE